jgi:hypothetical protein
MNTYNKSRINLLEKKENLNIDIDKSIITEIEDTLNTDLELDKKLSNVEMILKINRISIKAYKPLMMLDRLITEIAKNCATEYKQVYASRLLKSIDNIRLNLSSAALATENQKYLYLLNVVSELESLIQLLRLGLDNKQVSTGSYTLILVPYSELLMQTRNWYMSQLKKLNQE